MERVRFIVFLLGLASATVGTASAPTVAFPTERQRLPFVKETYLIGAVEPGQIVYVNGVTADVHRTGAFIAMVPVVVGTNEVAVSSAGGRLVRTFVVARESPPPADTPRPLVTADDSRLGKYTAWRTVGESIFVNRVRTAPNDGDTIFYLPKGFVLGGSAVSGLDVVSVWLEGKMGFIPSRLVVPLPNREAPPRMLAAPDVTAGFADHPPYGKRPEEVRICVDPGHGGGDPGTLSPHGWREKDVNLMLARAIRDGLERVGFQVVMTRDGDSLPSLLKRPQFANDERADAFISVHHNATAPHRDPRLARHVVTYASHANGLELAKAIHRHLAAAVAPVPDSGVQLKSLAVCRNPCVPSCLMEVDFINLPDGEAASWDAARMKKVADAVVAGVLDWMSPPAIPAAPVNF